MQPVDPDTVKIGDHYWAPWGSKGWSAVEIDVVYFGVAEAYRVNPATGERKSKRARAKIDTLLPRDPQMKGSDRPKLAPSAIFKSLDHDGNDSKSHYQYQNQDGRENGQYDERYGSFTSIEEAQEFFKETWELVFGEGSFTERDFPALNDG